MTSHPLRSYSQALRLPQILLAGIASGTRVVASLICLMALGACCYYPPVAGLRPINPPMFLKTTSNPLAMRGGYPVVDGKLLVFEWEPFEPPFCLSQDPTLARYDLRVWRVRDHEPGELVYARNSVAQPWHYLETTLKPHTFYYWSVRAHYLMDGITHQTDWSRIGSRTTLLGPDNPPTDIYQDQYFGFWTGAQVGDASQRGAARQWNQ